MCHRQIHQTAPITILAAVVHLVILETGEVAAVAQIVAAGFLVGALQTIGNNQNKRYMFEEKIIRHTWEKGEWSKEARYYLRIDTCLSCGCQRRVIQFWARGDMQKMVSTYSRSGQIFNPDNMPQCWGAKQPI